MPKITTIEMEIELADYFSYTRNLVVANVSWGMGLHECDLLVLSPSGYATEVEIKVSKSDLVKDAKKTHNHDHKKIKYLYFAIPDYLVIEQSRIPQKAGIIVVNWDHDYGVWRAKELRKPTTQYNYQFSNHDRYTLMRLAYLRIWPAKRKIREYEVKKRLIKKILNERKKLIESKNKSR